MVKPAPGQPDPHAENVNSLLARREALLRELKQINTQLAGQQRPLAEQRAIAAQPLRGSVTYHGDIVSPTGELWEAEQ